MGESSTCTCPGQLSVEPVFRQEAIFRKARRDPGQSGEVEQQEGGREEAANLNLSLRGRKCYNAQGG